MQASSLVPQLGKRSEVLRLAPLLLSQILSGTLQNSLSANTYLKMPTTL
jgi:hypothetical protein